jgi:membrane protein
MQWVETKERLMLAFSNTTKHDILVMASSLAYTTALALAPFMLIILSFASLLSANLQEKIYEGLITAMGAKVGNTLIELLENADKSPELSGLSGIVGVIVLAISASAIFSQLKIALDKINEHAISEDPKGLWNFVKKKLLSVGLVFGFAFLSVASLILTMLIAIFYPEGVGFVWKLISFVVNFSLFSVVFASIYRFVPTDRADWKSCIVSGVISTVFYLIGKEVIGAYLSSAGLESSYGAAGSLVVLLVWVYYSALTLLFSYEFTRDVILPGLK